MENIDSKIKQQKQQQEAIKQLINGIQVACSRGAFKLEEAAVLYNAVSVFLPEKNEKARD